MSKKLFITLLPLLVLGSCASPKGEEGSYRFLTEDGVPTIYASNEGNHVTYLMMSRYGYLDIDGVVTTGVAVPEKFYENCIIWRTDSDGALPSKDQVKSYVDGATFRGWAQYNNNVYPDYLEKVPSASGECVYAIFDGTNAGGGGGGGGGGGQTGETVTYTVTGFPNWIPDDGAVIFAWTWGGDSGLGTWATIELTYDGTNKNYTNVVGTFQAPSNITGFNMARCAAGTTAPDWTVTGDNPGRIYNKTDNVNVSTGLVTYSSPTWVEYGSQA